jgi:hypothetical protein
MSSILALTNSALAHEPSCGGGGGGVAWVSVTLSQWIQLCTWSPNKLWKTLYLTYDAKYWLPALNKSKEGGHLPVSIPEPRKGIKGLVGAHSQWKIMSCWPFKFCVHVEIQTLHNSEPSPCESRCGGGREVGGGGGTEQNILISRQESNLVGCRILSLKRVSHEISGDLLFTIYG